MSPLSADDPIVNRASAAYNRMLRRAATAEDWAAYKAWTVASTIRGQNMSRVWADVVLNYGPEIL